MIPPFIEDLGICSHCGACVTGPCWEGCPQFIENVGHSRSDSDCLAAPVPFNHVREIDRG